MKRKPKKLKLHYSGPNSKKFWSRIADIQGERNFSFMYLLGCTLQDLEGRIFQLLENIETVERLPRREAGKRGKHGER